MTCCICSAVRSRKFINSPRLGGVVCSSCYKRDERSRNKEKIAEYKKEYFQKNKDVIKEKIKEKMADPEVRERRLAQKAEYRKTNNAQVKATKQKWYEENKDYVAERGKERYAQHREQLMARAAENYRKRREKLAEAGETLPETEHKEKPKKKDLSQLFKEFDNE